jgi:hypothetical protein
MALGSKLAPVHFVPTNATPPPDVLDLVALGEKTTNPRTRTIAAAKTTALNPIRVRRDLACWRASGMRTFVDCSSFEVLGLSVIVMKTPEFSIEE